LLTLSAQEVIKADPATQAIPVVALTAFAIKGDATTIQAAGCDAYLAKPFRHCRVNACIKKRWLRITAEESSRREAGCN
jgi:two-component system, cell cycle response regulator DivK